MQDFKLSHRSITALRTVTSLETKDTPDQQPSQHYPMDDNSDFMEEGFSYYFFHVVHLSQHSSRRHCTRLCRLVPASKLPTETLILGFQKFTRKRCS
jgi:hypothetical protein